MYYMDEVYVTLCGYVMVQLKYLNLVLGAYGVGCFYSTFVSLQYACTLHFIK